MADLQQQLIWLGAGSAAEPALDFASFSKVTLIDARAEATQALTRQYSQANNIQVITQAVAASSAAASLQHYNLAAFAALTPATGLAQLFPGLKASQTENLTTKSINDLVSELALSGNQHTLVLDIPDQALSLLQALQSRQQLSLFTTIYLQYSNDELYAGMAPFSQLEAFFKQHYFTLKQTDNTDPDLPVYCFILDAAAKDVALLKQQLKTLTEKLASAEGQLSQAQQQAATEKQQATAEKQQAEQTKVELTKQLEQAKQQTAADKRQAEQTKAELTKQLEQAKQEAASEQKQAEQTKAELTKQLEQAQQQTAAEKQQAEQAKAELTKQLEQVKQQVSTEKQQAEQAKAEFAKQLEQLKQQTEENNKKNQQQALEQKHQFQQKLAELNTTLVNNVSENETLQQQLTAVKVAAEKKQAELNGRITGKDAELKQALEQRKNAEQQTSLINDKVTQQTQQLAELTRQAEQLQQRATEQQQLHAQQLNKLQAECDQVAKHAATRLDKINQLEQSKRQSDEVNAQLMKRQQALEHEMLKAQAQIDIIKDLLLKQ